MAEISLSVYELIGRQVSAGMEPDFKPVPTDNPYNKKAPARVLQGKIAGSPYYAYRQGVEYYLPITLAYTTAAGEVKEVELPYPVLSYQSRKRIVETPLTERTSTVKEYICTDSYELTVRGYLVGKNGELPEADLIAITDLYGVQGSLEIRNVITDILLVRPDSKDNVIITSYRKPEMRGVKHVLEYEFTMVSDAPFNLNMI